MPRFIRSVVASLVGAIALAFGPFAMAQVANQWPSPRLASVFPPGGKAGVTVEVTVLGSDIDQPEALWFSHPGIKSTLPAAPTPDPKADPKQMAAKKGAPTTAVKFVVVVDKAVPPGLYDVRVVGEKGISNPRVFVVGDQNEVLEKEPNNDVDQPQKIEMGTTVNGAILAPTDVDYFAIAAKKGQRFLVHVAGASIDSRINPEVAVFDLQNRRIAYARALPNEDALLDVTVPADGDYLIRVNQFTYTAGTPDYFYRLTVWGGPWIESVFPPVVEAGKANQVTLHGRGLPGGQPDKTAQSDGGTLDKAAVTINAPADIHKLDVHGNIAPIQGTLPGFEYRLGNSNAKFLPFARAPIVVENEDNDVMEKAQKVSTPCEIVGRLEKLRDRDWYAFDAKKGDVLVIDAISQRLGAPTDLFFKLMNAAKKTEIVLQDDTIDTLSVRGYYTANRDPQPYRFVVPEDGTYQLLVASHGNAAGPAYVYRVRVAPESPDFELIVLQADEYRPDSCNLGKGGVANFVVIASRQDGFKGDIALTIEGLPAEVTCPPQTLSGASKQAMLAIIASDKAAEKFEGAIKVIGTATINGQKVVREARPASVTWGSANAQGTSPSITRHDRSLMLALRNKAPYRVLPKKTKVAVAAGDKVDIPYALARIDPEFKANVQVQAAKGDLPTGITTNALTFAPGKDEQNMTVTTLATAAGGTYNLVLQGTGKVTIGKGKDLTVIFPTGPVSLVVVPKQVATLSLQKADTALPAGGETKVTVKVARLVDFPGELKVQLLPENTNGVTADPVTIGPGQIEATFALKAAAAAAVGQRANLTLRAVTVVEGITVNNDLKINVNVTAKGK